MGRKMRRLLAVLTVLAVSAVSSPAFAQTTGTAGTSGGTTGLAYWQGGTATIPQIGVDPTTMITNMITNVGAVVAVALGGYFGFLGLRRAAKWARTAFG